MMSVPDPASPRKPRRLGLYLPFAIALLAIIAWSILWVWARGEAVRRLDAAVAGLDGGGYRIAWKDRQVGGYPFRLDVTLIDAHVREPSGWGLDAPRLEAEAYLHAPGHWLIAAPVGLSFVRPEGGPVAVTGRILHASLTNLDKRPPSFSFEGAGLTFQPGPGARPFFLAGADHAEFHLRAGPDDEGGVFLNLTGGKAAPGGLFARISGDKPIALVWNSTLSKMSAFTGPDWPGAVRHWSAAGGQITVREGEVTAGEAMAQTRAGALTVGDDGRVRGSLPVTLRQAPRVLQAMGASGLLPPESAEAAATVAQVSEGPDHLARAAIDFQAGRATLGPAAVGPAPKVYTPR